MDNVTEQFLDFPIVLRLFWIVVSAVRLYGSIVLWVFVQWSILLWIHFPRLRDSINEIERFMALLLLTMISSIRWLSYYLFFFDRTNRTESKISSFVNAIRLSNRLFSKCAFAFVRLFYLLFAAEKWRSFLNSRSSEIMLRELHYLHFLCVIQSGYARVSD